MKPLSSRLPDREVRMPLRVLLVEDDVEFVRWVERALGPADAAIRVEHADTLGAALVIQDRNPADVILLDLGLPDSAPESTTSSASRLLGRSAPVFVLTGLDDESAALRALEAGVEDYFVKSQFDPGRLVPILTSAVQRRQSRCSDTSRDCLEASALRAEMRLRIAALLPGGTLTLTVIELDSFETLRQTWGAPWAQRISRSTADALGSATAGQSVVARLGQGVFAVLDPSDRAFDALLDATLPSVMSLSPEVSHPERFRITASRGSVLVPQDGTHPARLISTALDRARRSFRRSEAGGRFPL